MEVFFLMDIIFQFFREYADEANNKPVRELKKIASRYLKGKFIIDVIAISTIPLIFLFKDKIPERQINLFYLLRLLRVIRIVVLLDTQKFQQIIKALFRRNLNNAI